MVSRGGVEVVGSLRRRLPREHAMSEPLIPANGAAPQIPVSDPRAQRGRELVDRLGRFPVLPLVYIFLKYRLGMDSVIRVHDNLDHLQAVYSRMSLADLFGAPSATLDFTLGGLPRGFVGSEFSIGTVIAVTLPLLWGLLIAEVLYRFIAYYGMRRLLRATDLSSQRLVYLLVPSLFAILPFWHPGFASLAGVPLLLSALIRLHRVGHWRDYVIVGAFPMLGVAAATIPYAVILAAYAVVGRVARRVPAAVGRAAALFFGALLVVEWRLWYAVVTGPTSNRVGFGGSAADLSGEVFSMGRVMLEILEKHVLHASSAIVPLAFVLGVVVLFAGLVSRRPVDGATRVLAGSAVAIVIVVLAAAAWPLVDGHLIRPLIGDYPQVQLDRFVWLVPGLAYLAVASAAVALLRIIPRTIAIALVAVTLSVQGVAVWQLADFNRPPLAQLTINEFYAPDMFDVVRAAVEQDGGGTVVSVGFDPSVALYNGLDTADGAWSSYPLEYKERWEALIRPALDSDRSIGDYFRDYGNRVYVFQSVFGTSFCCEIQTIDRFELSINVEALADLNIDYLLSNGEVANSEELGLGLVTAVTQPDNPYRIFIYRT